MACEFSGIVREAFRARGHDAWSCDLEPAEDGSPFHFQQDVMRLFRWKKRKKWDLVIAHPPCTYLAAAGARHYGDRDDLYLPAANFAKTFFLCAPKVAVENPVGKLSTLWRKPDQYVQPFWFGDPYQKKTGLWLQGLPKLVPTNMVEPEPRVGKGKLPRWYSNLTEDYCRGKHRSKTFPGFARAMAEQWG